MKKAIFAAVLLVIVLAAAMPVAADNGAPSGAHYNLNIIGVPKNKTADMTGNNGHRIFVPLEGSTKIYLSEGDFAVLDANGTDGRAAFQLPLPAECYGYWEDTDGDGVDDNFVTPTSCTVRYTVWIRGLGKPGGAADMYTCIEDPDLPVAPSVATPTGGLRSPGARARAPSPTSHANCSSCPPMWTLTACLSTCRFLTQPSTRTTGSMTTTA